MRNSGKFPAAIFRCPPLELGRERYGPRKTRRPIVADGKSRDVQCVTPLHQGRHQTGHGARAGTVGASLTGP